MQNTQARRRTPISLAWLAGASVAALVGAVVSTLWLWQAGRGWPALLPDAIIALLGVLGIVWASRARTARRLAVLDAYAEREIARSRQGWAG
jgi:hypothetical protein